MIEPVKICKAFFSTLSEEEIKYCHWKSNYRLPKALAGETDLDLLIHPAEKTKFDQALERFSFKRVISPPEKRYPGTEDHLGFDYDTGKLIHLHVHYKLVLGRRHVKDYHLPIERMIFENLRILQNINVPCAEIELLLLTIRANMKLRFMSVLGAVINPETGPYPRDIMAEFGFLLRDYNEGRFCELLTASHLPLCQSILVSYVNGLRQGQLTIGTVMKVRSHIIKGLRPYRKCGIRVGVLQRFFAAFRTIPVARRCFFPQKKKMAEKGRIFALVGADGSGKSTLTTDLSEWLSWKLAVMSSYFGIPKTMEIRLFVGLVYVFRLIARLNPFEILEHVTHSLEEAMSARRWILIARKRLCVYAEAKCFASKGGIVLADRYPLQAFHTMPQPMDGPRIKAEDGGEAKKLSDREENYYLRIGLPDKIFVLQTEVDRLRERKENVEPRIHEVKARAVNALEPSDIVDVIDGNRPYLDVLLELKRRIWQSL